MSKSKKNALSLIREYVWFSELIQSRFASYFNPTEAQTSFYDIPPPTLDEDDSDYSQFVKGLAKHQADNLCGEDEQISLVAHRILLLLALAPEVKPEILDLFYTKNTLFDRRFSEFGGQLGKQHQGFLPTGETILFLLAGNDLTKRFSFLPLLDESHFLYRKNVLVLHSSEGSDPHLSKRVGVSAEYLARFTTGKKFQPGYSSSFPAQLITSSLTWNDLIVDGNLMEELEHLAGWVEKEHEIIEAWKVGHLIKAGYRALFYGPPGTGKSLAATLLGQRTQRPVYRIDLSQVVSKYIGETEKNLSRLFETAENRNWILFFDEADALFGKRSSANRDAQDRYANQEVAYLLQRIENYGGLIVLASNLKGNIDDAFSRRFQSVLYFKIPSVEQRLELWRKSFPVSVPQADNVDLVSLARQYELTGGSILNVARFAIALAANRENRVVWQADIVRGVKRELRKEGKVV